MFGNDPDAILRRLNGRKHLIFGNHDGQPTRHSQEWSSRGNYREIKLGSQHIVMSHYAMRVWNRSHRGSIMLYGHSHGSLPGNSQSLDVGVDAGWDYRPITLDEIQKRLKTLPLYKNPDHHGT